MRSSHLTRSILLAAVVLAVLGCTSPRQPATASGRTLAGNARFPEEAMARLVPPERWAKLRELDYAGYVILEATIRSDGSVTLGREIECYPDRSWSQLARALGQQVQLRATTLGSLLEAKAEIYVVFYPDFWDGRMALIFGQQVAMTNGGANVPATCLTTLRY